MGTLKDELLKIRNTLDGLITTLDKPAAPPEEDRPSISEGNKKLLWYPIANLKHKMASKGKYEKNYPIGAVVHFTAGRSLKGDSDAEGSVTYGQEQGYSYFTISSTGTVFQGTPLDSWGHHAGVSTWPSLGSGLSEKLVGIEIAAAGRLEKISDNEFKSWFGEVYNKDQVRYGKGEGHQKEGYYLKYTDAQEKALINLLVWLKTNNPSVFNFDNVLGHDEVAPTRKNDPGYALSMSMPKLREKLKSLI